MRIYGLLVNLSDLEALHAQGLRFAICNPLGDERRDLRLVRTLRSPARGHQPTMVYAMGCSAATTISGR